MGVKNGVGRALALLQSFTSSNSGNLHYANRILMNSIGQGLFEAE